MMYLLLCFLRGCCKLLGGLLDFYGSVLLRCRVSFGDDDVFRIRKRIMIEKICWVLMHTFLFCVSIVADNTFFYRISFSVGDWN